VLPGLGILQVEDYLQEISQLFNNGFRISAVGPQNREIIKYLLRIFEKKSKIKMKRKKEI
jgi:hypothetical protein